MITEDHNYQNNSTSSNIQRGQAADMVLFKILKSLRKIWLKKLDYLGHLFMEPSLIDMANQYPTTLEELAKHKV